jgi:hypothetical protein
VADIVIDLNAPQDEEPTPPVARRQLWRELTAALVVLATLLSVSSARPADKPLLIRLATIDDRGGQGPVGIVDGLVFRSDRQGVAAYEPDGRQRWISNLNLSGSYSVAKARDWLIVTAYHGQSSEIPTTVALDPLTGKEIWRLDGNLIMAGDYMVTSGPVESATQVRKAGSREIVWELPPQRATVVYARENLIYSLGADGKLAVRDLVTGQLLQSAALPAHPEPWRYFSVSDDLIQVFTTLGPEDFLILDRQTLQVPAGPAPQWLYKRDCGPVICALDLDFQTSILDRGTERELWRPLSGDNTWRSDAGILLADGEHESRLANFFTGESIALPGWVPVHAWTSDDVRYMRRHHLGKGTTEVGVLTARGVVTLAILPALLLDCWTMDDIMACQLLDQKIGVWRFVR